MDKVIMVVDDQKDERKLVRLLLRKYACQVVEVPNPAEAVKMARLHKPNLVLMDHVMPQMTGYECIAALRESGLPRTPIIMLTARKFDSGWEAFIKMSIEGFLTKPVEANSLLAAIQGILGPLEVRAASPAA